MKTLCTLAAVIVAQLASGQLLRPAVHEHASALRGTSCLQGLPGGGTEEESGAAMAPAMRAEDQGAVYATGMMGDGGGAMISMMARPRTGLSFGFRTGSYYLLAAQATMVPLFAQVRYDFWSTRGNGYYGAAYGYAAGGPALGLGSSLFAMDLGSWLHSLTLRFGAGAMTGIGAEFGGSALGWSAFTEAGALAMSYTAPLGPRSAYAAPFFALGVRRAIGW